MVAGPPWQTTTAASDMASCSPSWESSACPSATVGGAAEPYWTTTLAESSPWSANQRSVHVTSRSIDVESGLLSKNIETLQLWKVRDIEFRQTLTDRLMGVARIRIFTTDVTTPQFLLWGLPGSRKVFERLKESIEISRQTRNVIGVVE